MLFINFINFINIIYFVYLFYIFHLFYLFNFLNWFYLRFIYFIYCIYFIYFFLLFQWIFSLITEGNKSRIEQIAHVTSELCLWSSPDVLSRSVWVLDSKVSPYDCIVVIRNHTLTKV